MTPHDINKYKEFQTLVRSLPYDETGKTEEEISCKGVYNIGINPTTGKLVVNCCTEADCNRLRDEIGYFYRKLEIIYNALGLNLGGS